MSLFSFISFFQNAFRMSKKKESQKIGKSSTRPNNRKPSQLLNLPEDLRQKIWDMTIPEPEERPHFVKRDCDDRVLHDTCDMPALPAPLCKPSPILFVNKQVNEEVRESHRPKVTLYFYTTSHLEDDITRMTLRQCKMVGAYQFAVMNNMKSVWTKQGLVDFLVVKLRMYYTTVQADVQDSYYYANQVWFFVKITVSGAKERQ